ncbi:MAG: potassium transporter Kup [Gemmatimonadetes bacterium]|nr:potassium transporter Kup [Gemmatimonadota bacterium]
MPGAAPAGADSPRGRYLLGLSLAALGVVYGDIGTSPLYAIRECFFGPYGVAPSRANVLGVLSLILWALVVVISVKYLVFIMRADNRGEGGILALLALSQPARRATPHGRLFLVALGLFGAALLYGDGMITPAISVLSAIEGLEIATPVLAPFVIPITVGILVGLFLFQRRGTAGVGAVFGPVTLVWFLTLALLGTRAIAARPEVLAALNPLHGAAFFGRNGLQGFLVLGAVFLVVTGGEALYADMGHFGRRPIRLAWFALVLPALLLNYFGQGALLLRDPEAAHNPFYRLAPGWALYPMVLLATAATVIASQAVISGSFSLTRQAVQLGYSPRVQIQHTSPGEIGQIYIPPVNWALMLATIALVLGFGSSSRLAAAYGVAVTTTMVITTVLFYVVARDLWRWSRLAAGGLAAVLISIDAAFFGANIIKVEHGGWFPLLVAAGVYTLMTTWKRGREILRERLRKATMPLSKFLQQIAARPLERVPGAAVFMTGSLDVTPPALLQNVRHNKVLHEKLVLLTVVTEEIPHVPREERVEIQELQDGIYRVILHYGFMQDPDIPRVLDLCRERGLDLDLEQTTFFLGRETLLATEKPGMALWRERLFAFMARNALRATAFFHIPSERVIEVGWEVEL